MAIGGLRRLATGGIRKSGAIARARPTLPTEFAFPDPEKSRPDETWGSWNSVPSRGTTRGKGEEKGGSLLGTDTIFAPTSLTRGQL